MILTLCGYFWWVTASKLLLNVDPQFCSKKKNKPLKPKQCVYSCFHVPCLNACVCNHVFAKKVHCQTACRSVRCFQSCTSVKGVGIVKSYGKGNMWQSCRTSSDQQLHEQHSAPPQYEKMQVPWSTVKGWTMN